MPAPNTPLKANTPVTAIRPWLNDMHRMVHSRPVDHDTGSPKGPGMSSIGTVSAFAVLTGDRDIDDFVLADIFRGDTDTGNLVEIRTGAQVVIRNKPPDGSLLWDPVEGLIVPVILNRGYWEGVVAEAEDIEDPPATGVYVYGAVDGVVDWLDTVEIDYGGA